MIEKRSKNGEIESDGEDDKMSEKQGKGGEERSRSMKKEEEQKWKRPDRTIRASSFID
jgi:hypothetical protein